MATTPRHETPAELPAEALRERIAGCLITARERTELLTGSVDDFIERYVSKDRCPADDLLEELR